MWAVQETDGVSVTRVPPAAATTRGLKLVPFPPPVLILSSCVKGRGICWLLLMFCWQ